MGGIAVPPNGSAAEGTMTPPDSAHRSGPRTAARPPTPGTRRHTIGAIVFTVALLSLIALSVNAVAGWLVLGVLGAVVLVVGTFHYLFPNSRFFTIALANFIGIYACVFVFFIEANFAAVGPGTQSLGFMLPLMAFLVGALRRREDIRRIVETEELRGGAKFTPALVWLLPVAAVGVGTFLIPDGIAGDPLRWLFLGAMAAISLVVLFASRHVTVLLLDSGLLFEEFWDQIARLAEPAFAFLTFYSLLVIVFAAIYTVLDRYSTVHHFSVHGDMRDISFAESLYFSVITLSTVGYGDIFPMTDMVRVIVAGQVVLGVLLLLFGFNAIFTYAVGRRRPPPG